MKALFPRRVVAAAGFWTAVLGVICLGAVQASAAQPDLRLTLVHSSFKVNEGELLTASLTVTNAGAAPATGVSLVLTLPTNAVFFSAQMSQGSYSQSSGTVTCTLGGLLVQSGAAVSVMVTPTALGGLTNRAVVSEIEADAQPGDNSASASSLVVPTKLCPAGNLLLGRKWHTATLLNTGKILVVGGTTSTGGTATAELYDPNLGTSVFTGPLNAARNAAAAARLSDGRVLIAGPANAELYEPATGTFSTLTNLLTPRYQGQTATLLSNGKVLIAGGYGGYYWYVNTTELFDPVTRAFSAGPAMSIGRCWHTATRLNDGSVLLVGNADMYNPPAKGDLIDASGTSISLTTNECPAPLASTASLLPNGRVLIAGGQSGWLYDPNTRFFSGAMKLLETRYRPTSASFSDGTALVAGGSRWGEGDSSSTTDLYLPAQGRLVRGPDMIAARDYAMSVQLPDGRFVILGGMANTPTGQVIYASVEIYDPTRGKVPPLVSVSDSAAPENAGSLRFDFTLWTPMGYTVSVDYATSSGSAAEGVDYTGVSGTVIFPPGITNQSVSVPLIDDLDYEPTETFTLNLSNPTNALLGVWQATGSILNDDPRPTLVAPAAAGFEGNIYATNIPVNLYLTAASYEQVRVDFFTSDGTALAGSDYVATNGVLVFDPGVTNLTLRLGITSDIVPEPDKVFYLNYTNALNVAAAPTQTPVTILNDDGVPGVVHHFDIDRGPLPYPQYLQVPFPVTITAKDLPGQTVTSFSGGVTAWGTLTNVPWLEFNFEEGDFSQWTPLNIGNPPGPYQIVPFDVAGNGTPTLAFRMAADSGLFDGITRPINLVGGATYFLSVDLAAANEDGGLGNGDASTAFIKLNGQNIAVQGFGGSIGGYQIIRTNVFASFIVPTTGVYDLAVTFVRGAGQAGVWSYADNVRISAAPLKPFWVGPFTNGVWAGNLSLNFLAKGFSLLAEDPEGHPGASKPFDVDPAADLALTLSNSTPVVRAGSDLVFTLLLTNRGPSIATNITVTDTFNGDVILQSASNNFGTATFLGNAATFTVNTLMNGRLVTLSVTAKPHSVGWITNGAGVNAGTYDPIATNDLGGVAVFADLPLLHVSSISVPEGDSGSSLALVPAWLEGPVGSTLGLDYSTVDGTATSGLDYLGGSGTIVFPPGVVTQYIQVPIIGDIIDEPNETVTLLLTNVLNAVLAQTQATLTIVDDDPLPVVTIADTSVLEGNSGTTNAVFQLTLSNPSSSEAQVTCSTSNGTATNGTDYIATIATVIFPAGTTNQTFAVPVIGDIINEPDQTFFVTLSTPINCTTIGRSPTPATGTIINDDAVPGRILRFTFDPPASPQYRGRAFPLTIRALDSWDQPAITFNGMGTIAAQTDGFYVKRLFDDFEDGDVRGWTNYATSSLVFSNVNDVSASGSHSLRLTGKASAPYFYSSLEYRFSNSRPNKVSFNVRGAQTNASCGRMWLVGGAGYRAFDFCLNKDGRMGLNTSTGLVAVAYAPNRWYKVDMDLNWGTGVYPSRKLSMSIDGTQVVTNLNFLDDTYAGADYIALQNSDSGTAWFDDIHVYDSYPSNLVIAPTSVGPFSSGVWSGNVTISQSASNAYVSITDNSEHTGKSPLFDVLTGHLNVLAPLAITEGSAPVPAQVSIPAAFSQNLVIGLTSSVPAELTVPANVTIAAGQTNAGFNITVVDDTVLDGSQVVTIFAGNTNLNTGSTTVSVDDNERTAITLTTPVSVMENAGIQGGQGRVTLAAAPAKAVSVLLASSDTNVLRVPPFVTINAGQTAANFNVTVVDNPFIDGNKLVTVSASVANWTNDSKVITIVDNEDTLLRLSGPAQLSEEGGTAAYSARISGLLATNLDLVFTSSNTNALVVPTGATIPAGATNVTFTANIVDNTLADGAKVVLLTGSAPGFASFTNTVTVLDNEIHHLGFSAIAPPQTSSVPFNVTVSARDILDGPATAFTGSVTLAGAGPGGPCIVQPTNVTLVNGSWSGTVTVFSSDTQVTLTAVAGNGLSGQSASFAIVPPVMLYAPVAGGALVYSEASQRIWALVGSSSTLVPINPFNSFVEPGVSAGPSAGRIITSAEGRYLHIVGSSGLAVRRFDTLTRSIDMTLTNSGLTAVDISSSPTNSGLVAVCWACPGCSPAARGTFLYENGVARSNSVGGLQIEFGDSPEDLFYYDTDNPVAFSRARVDASGLVFQNTMPVMGYWGDEFNCAGGKIFSRSGAIYDQHTGALITTGSSGWSLPADRSTGRLYNIWYYTTGPIAAYDLETLLPVGSANIPGPLTASSPILWGTNGLAFCASSKVIVARATLRPTAPATDLAVSATTTNLWLLSSNVVHYPLTVSNPGPNTGSNLVVAVLLPSNVTLASATCASGFVTNQTASSFVWRLEQLVPGGSSVVDLTLVGGLPGLGGARISLTADNVDPNRANNLLTPAIQVGYEAPPDSITVMQQVTSDLAWNASRGRILMAVENAPPNVGPSLLLLDPATGRFETPVPTGFGPNKLSVHPAGRYVYAGLDRQTAITRIDLANRTADLTFPVPHTATDVAVEPDDPAVVATTVSSWPQVLVYRNGVQLPNKIDPGSYLWDYFVEFSSVSPTLLYCAYPDSGFRRIRVDANGATLLEEIGGMISGFDREMRCDGGLVFTAGGRIFNPETKTFIATVPYGGLVAADAASGRVFYLNGSGTSYNLVCLSFTNLQLAGSVAITNVSGTPTSLIRWGADGLAFRTTGNQVYLIRTSLVGDRNGNGLPDQWEIANFGALGTVGGGPNDDPDHDGFTNLQEYRLGLNPNVFDGARITQLRQGPDLSAQLSVLGVPGQPYTLLATTNLADWLPLYSFSCTNLPMLLSDPAATNYPTRFYWFGPSPAGSANR